MCKTKGRKRQMVALFGHVRRFVEVRVASVGQAKDTSEVGLRRSRCCSEIVCVCVCQLSKLLQIDRCLRFYVGFYVCMGVLS